MRFFYLLMCLGATPGSLSASGDTSGGILNIRQDRSSSPFPVLTSGAQATSVTGLTNSQSQIASKSASSTVTSSPTPIENNTTNNSSTVSSTPTTVSNLASSTFSDAVASTSLSSSSAVSSMPNNATAIGGKTPQPLPLPPKITPALSIGGTILIITGTVYLLIGVKNRLIHVFLSTAYLTSLATLVLVLYVINPPVKDAIQGAYFVGVFMCGIIFGGGALIFQDITEGFGCLLGGFTLSMWFLTLKPGGLITSTGGKAIFIAAFCVLTWSLSFSHYTRAYGLIGSTSFAGSMAVVLGIDCFSKAGYKEFWVYLWELNDNLFLLNTSTYPFTKGIRVELVIVILGTIVGVISQVRLWRLVRDRQKAREAVKAEDERRRDAVEEALGRHLERQNDKDRSEWEKRYGDRLNSKRNTVLWSEAHNDKGLSSVSMIEVEPDRNSESADNLEMTHMQLTGQRPGLRMSKSIRRQGSLVQPILEVEEEGDVAEKFKELRLDSALGRSCSRQTDVDAETQPPTTGEFTRIPSEEVDGGRVTSPTPTLRPSIRKPSSKRVIARLQQDNEEAQPKRNSVHSLSDLKGLSMQSLRPKSRADSDKSAHAVDFSESAEALVKPPSSTLTRSRASSIAATLDEENEELAMLPNEGDDVGTHDGRLSNVFIPSASFLDVRGFLSPGIPEPSSPSAVSDGFEDDPEAVIRIPTTRTTGGSNHRNKTNNASKLENLGNENLASESQESQLANAEALTKGALEQVPSQMSNVVLSYRTNEWAKHITTAEAPIFEEPDLITTDDKEEPAHLAHPSSTTPDLQQTESQLVIKPPELPLPIMSVEHSESGMKVNPEIQPVEKAPSRPGSRVEFAPQTEKTLIRSSSQTSLSNPTKRSFTEPTQQAAAVPKAPRRISNPAHRQPTLAGMTIDENSATNFASMPNGQIRSASAASYYPIPQQNFRGSPSPDMFRSNSPAQQYPSAFRRNTPTPTFSHQNYSSPDLRPATAHTSTPSLINMAAMRSETRLSNYGNSHQPLQRHNTNDSSRRETLMADWRNQLTRSNSPLMPQFESADAIQDQLIYDNRMIKAKQEAEKFKKAQREAAMDQTMRTQGMIDAHREVLKKMQSQANKTLNK